MEGEGKNGKKPEAMRRSGYYTTPGKYLRMFIVDAFRSRGCLPEPRAALDSSRVTAGILHFSPASSNWWKLRYFERWTLAEEMT